MTVLEVLKAARGLLSDERRWTKGAWARDATGRAIKSREPGAVCYCPVSAIYLHDPDGRTGTCAVHALGVGGAAELVDYSDAEETTHADIMRLFDRAIEL